MHCMHLLFLALFLPLWVCANTNQPAMETKDQTIPEPSPSGMPLPGTETMTAPTGTGCDLVVLDWAGFSGAASYSFDDGQPSQIAHWRELKATGVPMTFYLVTSGNWPARYDATWKDALASGCELGNHSDTHKRVDEYQSLDTMNADVEKCSRYISGRLGQEGPCSFAYPFGELGWRDAVKDRFLLARSVASGTVMPGDDTDPLALPIFAVDSSNTEEDFDAALDTSVTEKSWIIFMFHSILPGDNWYAGVPIGSVTGSLRHAKDGGRLWLDTVENIGAYWLAQKLFTKIEPSGTESAKTWSWTLPKLFPRHRFLRVRVAGGTLSQDGQDIPWNPRGFYEISLDSGKLGWRR
jgi:hypothetical protein